VKPALLHRLAFGALLGLVIAFGIVGCGKKGDPVLPDGQTDKYPHSYPQTTDPQTGIFSN
jgi:predicted small lipoprotein YifL